MENPADYLLRNKRSILAALEAIAQGYKTEGIDDRYIVVENPDHNEEWGTDPNLVIDTFMFRELVTRLESK